MIRALPLAWWLLAAPLAAQTTVSPLNLGGSIDDTARTAAAQALSAAQAACVATPAIPPMEAVGGAAGTNNGQCRPVGAVQPRITRGTVVVTDASCNWSAAWTNALTAVPTISLTWVNPGTNSIKCELTADPTATTAQGRCKVDTPAVITLSALTAAALAGLTINPSGTSSACAGIKVHVIALPPAT